MNLAALAFSTGWASGVNAYLVVLVLGLSERFGDVSAIPDVLGRVDVLIGAAVLYGIEFVADKVPYLDSTWDAISTVLRPTVAAAIGVAVAGTDPDANAVLYGGMSGLTALASHSVKAGSRLAINTSPEPFTNIGASLGEDVTVLGVVVLAINHPVIALGVTATLLVLGLVTLFFVVTYVRRGWRRWKGHPLPTG
ncbi:MAG: hypothetical protein JWO46_1603 [Nocardioidaceae bacterium]|nr:hypothetical protein [Nocardioidaceae bacterium]